MNSIHNFPTTQKSYIQIHIALTPITTVFLKRRGQTQNLNTSSEPPIEIESTAQKAYIFPIVAQCKNKRFQKEFDLIFKRQFTNFIETIQQLFAAFGIVDIR